MIKLLKHPDPFLSHVADDFDFNNPIMDPLLLEEKMVKLMAEENGIGLAATQVGVNARVFTIKTQLVPEITEPFAAFNPTVLKVSEETSIDYEGCLSFPNLYLAVKRPASIIASFVDRDNNERIIELSGIDARCYLHELDHLNGICYVERVSKLKLELAKKKQRKLNGRAK